MPCVKSVDSRKVVFSFGTGLHTLPDSETVQPGADVGVACDPVGLTEGAVVGKVADGDAVGEASAVVEGDGSGVSVTVEARSPDSKDSPPPESMTAKITIITRITIYIED